MTEIGRNFPKKASVLLILDDTLVKKCGKHIHGVYAWFDHSCGWVVTSLCLVNVSLVVDDQLLCMIPWIFRKPQNVFHCRGKISKDQDKKNLAAIEMIQTFRKWLAQGNISDKQIVVVADSWHSNQIIQTYIKQTGMNFRLDARSNLTVQCPDHQALRSRGKRRQGRARRKYVCYILLKQFFGNSRQ